MMPTASANASAADNDRLRLAKAVADRTEQSVADINRSYVPTAEIDGIMGEALAFMRARMLEVTSLARAAVPAMTDADATVLDMALQHALDVKPYVAISRPAFSPASASRRRRK